MKTLPYFRWYPADWETDKLYKRMTDQERGFFHRCLNHSWINDGLPADLDELAEEINVARRYIEKLWPKVSALFTEREGRLFNDALVAERANAISKSENNARYGNANASKQKRERVPEETRTRSSENANDSQHALARAESVCVSESSMFFPRKESAERKPNASERFAEFWDRYPLKDESEDLICQLWLSVATVDQEPMIFACLDRYLASDHVARKIIKSARNWLHDCAKAGWACEWPAAMKPNGTAGKMTEAEIKAAILAARKEKRT